MGKEYSIIEKLSLVRRTVHDWWKLPLDKAGLARTIDYHPRLGGVLRCRSRTTDINEAVVVLSGEEYPRPILESLPPEASVLDLGANIGAFCLYSHFVGRSDFRMAAVEPFLQNHELLKHNLRSNGMEGVEVFLAAITASHEKVALDVNRPMDAIRVSRDGNGEIVDGITLLGLMERLGWKTVDLLKMDIEGSEIEVVPSAASWIREKVRQILIEVHLPRHEQQPWLSHSLGGTFDIQRIGRHSVYHAVNRVFHR